MKRRNFVLLSGGILAALATSTYYLFFEKIKYPKPLSHPKSLATILEMKDIKELGEAYRKQVSDESSERTLVELLLKELHDNNVTDSTIATMIKEDFDNRNIIEVNGWILSKTEARQCALLTFLKE